jgi:PAS domain-containing serine/threonine kinase
MNDQEKMPSLMAESLESEATVPRSSWASRRSSTDLFEFIDTHPLSTETSIKHIFRQLAHTVLYLHQNDVVHRDIKDENVVIDEDLNVKLIDFGVADRIPNCQDDYFPTFRGSKYYIPPEILSSSVHRGPEVDIWCLGIVLYILSYSGPPFQTMEDIKYQRYTPTSVLRSMDLQDLISQMLRPNPALRYTIEQVCSHPWLSF